MISKQNLALEGIPKRFRALRGKEKLRAFCPKVGIAPSEWSQYEKGRKLPRLERVQKICSITGVSAIWLLAIEGESSEEYAPPANLESFAPRDRKLIQFRQHLQNLYDSPYFEMYIDLMDRIVKIVSQGGEKSYEGILQILQLIERTAEAEKAERAKKRKGRRS